MNFLRLLFFTLISIPVFSLSAAVSFAAQAKVPSSPEQLRLRIIESVGALPRNSEYRIDGRFILAATGEDIRYQARIVQASGFIAGRTTIRRAADFTHENRTRNLRFFLSGETTAWISSPEITVDVAMGQIPYMARFDFHTLYAGLLDILAQGTRSPDFRIERKDNEIYVFGKLQNGWDAVFTLNNVEFYPRKVKISTGGEKTAAWMIPNVSPGNIWRPQPFPEWTTEFEVWMSSPAAGGYYRYARRIDFVEQNVVVGGFSIVESQVSAGNKAESEMVFVRPPVFPLEEGIRFESAGSDHSGIFSVDSLNAMRSRLDESPWSRWERHGRKLAYLSLVFSWFSLLPFYPLPPKVLLWIIASGYVIFLVLLLKFSRPGGRPGARPMLQRFPRKTAITGFFIGFIVFIAGISIWITRLPVERSRMTLHAAIRYAATEGDVYAAGANLFFKDFARKAPAETLEDLGRSSQNYAVAYDLIRNYLTPQRRAQIETDLFDYARPLLGAASGWRANGRDAAEIASGLGLTGLAIGFEPFVTASEAVIEQILSDQLSEGLHRAGPGQGNAAMDAAVNLFYGLRLAGRADYYADTRFQEYISTTLKLLSPAGTLPFFGGATFDDSLDLSLFLLKVADKMPDYIGRQCVAAHNLYMEYGIFNSEGWSRRIASRLLPFLAYYENPHVLLQYETAVAPSELPPEEGFATGDGQFAALRAGSGADAMYLAINMLRSGYNETAGDALSFDLFAKRSLMLHGSVLPLENAVSARIVSNTPLFNDESQTANGSAGITSALLNQPVFDSARAVADRAYAYGQIKRDFILARPGEGIPGYFVVMDNISGIDFGTPVKWRVNGRGETASGIDQRIRWNSTALGRPRLWNMRASLEFVYPIGMQGTHSTLPGMIMSRHRFFNQQAQSAQVEWLGNGRFCSILIPYGEKEQPPIIEAQGEYACRIGTADWFSFGDLSLRIKSGAFEHVSEYSLIRSRGEEFPALIMAFGTECRSGAHSIVSDKPVTASLDGPRGGFLNEEPNTRVTIRSPEIKGETRFFLDGNPVVSKEQGVLAFTLSEPGTHYLR